MKKSRIAKLALMGASITALAATLTTSTYAWYVSNKTANVSAVSGQTNATAGDGSIALSTTGQANKFYRSIALNTTTNFNAYVSSGNPTITLNPVCTTDGATFTNDDGSAPQSTSYFKFMFYVRAESGCTIRPTITVVNTTTTVPTQVNYSTATTDPISYLTGKVGGQGQTFTIDALNAMYISQFTEIGNAQNDPTATTAYSAASSQTGAISGQCSNLVDGANVASTLSSDIANYARIATAGAHNYYTEIQGAPSHITPYGEATTTNELGDITLVANVPQKLTYYVWLDGADDQCFNSCAAQQFTFAFSYTVQ